MTRTMMMKMMMMMTITMTVTEKTTLIILKTQIFTTNKPCWDTKMHLFHYNNNR